MQLGKKYEAATLIQNMIVIHIITNNAFNYCTIQLQNYLHADI